MFELYGTGNYSLRETTSLVNREGLRTRKGYRLSKSTAEKTLKDPIHCGDFRWDGRVYRGTHKPIITRELFDRVQETFANHNRPLQTKHEFSFTGLLTCKRCGWAITAEVKKNKYIYYHCTGYKGNCGNTRITEEDLDKRFAELVRRIEVPSEIAEWKNQ